MNLTKVAGGFQGNIDPQEQAVRPLGFVMIALDIEKLEHLAGWFFTGVASLQNDLHIRVDVAYGAHHFLTAHARHEVVHDDEVELTFAKKRARLETVDRGHHAMPFALEQELAGNNSFFLIVNDQN